MKIVRANMAATTFEQKHDYASVQFYEINLMLDKC